MSIPSLISVAFVFATFSILYPMLFGRSWSKDYKGGYRMGVGCAFAVLLAIHGCIWLTDHLHIQFL
jgi:hypothetical protein